jgi:hypothetical protein
VPPIAQRAADGHALEFEREDEHGRQEWKVRLSTGAEIRIDAAPGGIYPPGPHRSWLSIRSPEPEDRRNIMVISPVRRFAAGRSPPMSTATVTATRADESGHE